jgi:hypothetical protein
MKFLKYWRFFVVLLSIGMIILAIFYRRRITEHEINASLDKALTFLNKSYSKEYLFEDPYIKCIGQLSDCYSNYRKLDIATLVVFFLSGHIKDDSRISQIVSDATGIISGQLKEWKNVSLKRIPIDLYAVLVYYYPNETKNMLRELIYNLKPDGSWEDYDMYRDEMGWRKVTDESWPIVALAKHKVEWKIIKKTLDKKKEEVEKTLNSSFGWTKLGKYYAVLTSYHTFLWVKEEGYDISEYLRLIKKMEDWLAKQPADEYLKKWPVVGADTLYWLSEGNYSDKKFLEGLAKELIENQEKDGGWRMSTLKKGERTESGLLITEENYDSGRSHATIMAILALESYKRNIMR